MGRGKRIIQEIEIDSNSDVASVVSSDETKIKKMQANESQETSALQPPLQPPASVGEEPQQQQPAKPKRAPRPRKPAIKKAKETGQDSAPGEKPTVKYDDSVNAQQAAAAAAGPTADGEKKAAIRNRKLTGPPKVGGNPIHHDDGDVTSAPAPPQMLNAEQQPPKTGRKRAASSAAGPVDEAKLRKKIEKEIADRQRKEMEAERKMEEKMRRMINAQLREQGLATYRPPSGDLSRRTTVQRPRSRQMQGVVSGHHQQEDEFDDYEEDDDDSIQSSSGGRKVVLTGGYNVGAGDGDVYGSESTRLNNKPPANGLYSMIFRK